MVSGPVLFLKWIAAENLFSKTIFRAADDGVFNGHRLSSRKAQRETAPFKKILNKSCYTNARFAIQ